MADVIMPTGGILAMMAQSDNKKPVYRTLYGNDAVDRMLSGGDPSRRFKVYRRNLGTDENGNWRNSSGSLAHWLFISDDGKEGFGFNEEGEQLEFPTNLEGYEEHPDFSGKTYTASGLINARRSREQSIADRYQFAEDNPWLFTESGEMPDLAPYRRFLNNCQHYVRELNGYYRE